MAKEPAVTKPLPTSPLPSTSGTNFSESVDRAEVEIDPEAPEDYDELSAMTQVEIDPDGPEDYDELSAMASYRYSLQSN